MPSQPPVVSDRTVYAPQIVGNLDAGEHTLRAFRGGVAVRLGDEPMPIAVNGCQKYDIEAALQSEVLVNHLAHRLGLDLPRVGVCLRVVEEVDDDIIGQKVVDIVDEVAKIKGKIGVFLIARLLRPVEQRIDHEVLRIINHISLQFRAIEDGVDIGAGAAVIGPITVGKNAIIGANAVVTHDVPAQATVAGNPAKIIRIKE